MATLDDTPRTAVNQAPHGGSDYPFAVPGDFVGAVLDAYVSYYDPTDQYVLPLSLHVTVEGGGTNFIVNVRDANGLGVVGCEEGDFVTRAWGDRTVYEWGDDPNTLRLVIRRALMPGDGDYVNVLDPRTYNRMTRHVRAIRVGLFRITGNVRFESGFNVPIAGADPVDPVEGGRFRPQVAMDAVPGAGAGRLNGCDDVAPVIKKINNVGPDCAGNFKIEFDDCFRAQLPLFMQGLQGEARTGEYSAEGFSTDEAMHALKLYSDCHPCCDCSYYVRTYRGLKRMWGRWKDIAEDAERVRDVYRDNLDRWNASRDCRINNPSRLLMTQDRQCKTSVGGSFCNFTNCCVRDIEIRFTFTKFVDGDVAAWTGGGAAKATISGSFTQGEEEYAPQIMGDGRVIRFFFPHADPAAMSIAKMKACLPSCDTNESLGATMTVHAETPEMNEHTGDSCTTPTADVPEEILAIWDEVGVPLGAPIRAVVKRAVGLNPDAPSYPCGC